MPLYLLDTNIVSELRRNRPHPAVVKWLGSQVTDELFLSAVSFGEMQRGIEATRKTNPTKAQEIETWLDEIKGAFQIIAMDDDMFRAHARLMHRRTSVLSEDAMIAATALTRGLTVATRNTADFRQFTVALVNPFDFKG